jgi:TRAP-type mannitol/chloroaromatic compound transport system substrate-binding protein
MNNLLKELMEKSEIIEKIDLPKEKIIDVPKLQDFYELKGKIYHIKDQDILIKIHEKTFYRHKYEENSQNIEVLSPQNSSETQDFQKEVMDWANSFKNAVETDIRACREAIDKINQNQEEFFRTTKEYIDARLEVIKRENGKN